jgi:miniconductance mechanosensitive channel
MKDFLATFQAFQQDYPVLFTAAQLGGLALAVWLADLLTQSLLVRAVRRAVHSMQAQWSEALLRRRVIARLAHVIPALLVYYGITLVTGLPAPATQVIRAVASAYVVFTLALSFSNLLNSLGEVYEKFDQKRARERPIKGYLQVVKIVVYLLTAILIIATLFDRDPLLLLSGLGAMTAVLLLVFKDTILSLVASVQLSSNDMLRVGDWIEMPQLGADGDVIDISLHTVKVQNWDRTITTIPTWRLIAESYRNWRGMSESGGRRIKRALYLDQTSVRFLDGKERERLRRFALIDEYLEHKRTELEQFNEKLLAQGKDPVNTRRVTNLGTFRAYIVAYLRNHPQINQNLTLMARQREPGPTGVPLEVYCFTATTEWIPYEGIQSDIFDYLYAILPEFGLRVFQQPSGADLALALANPKIADQTGPGP